MRDLAREWWFGCEELISISFSESQFVELIGRTNIGDGVPCTLNHVMGERMLEPPVPVSEAKKFRADMQADADKCVASLEAAIARLDAYLEAGKMTKAELKQIRHDLYYDALCSVKAGIPFVQKSFDEKIENTVNHAAAEIEATVANMAMRLGVERIRELNDASPKLIEAPEVK
jgi:hypothetical protein